MASSKSLSLIFSRHNTVLEIENVLIDATNKLTENPDTFTGVVIHMEGYDYTGVHQAMIRSAKHKYAELIQAGLIGFLLSYDYTEKAQEAYAMAYLKARRKGSSLRFSKVDESHMKNVAEISSIAYYLLTNSNMGEEKVASDEE